MIILGIDPGLQRTGWAVIKKTKNADIEYIGSGVIITKDSKEENEAMRLASRINHIFISLSSLIKKYSISVGGIEKTYVNKNSGSSLKLAHARAASILACAQADVLLHEYQAKTAKKTLTGNGNASKSQVESMLRFYLNTFDLGEMKFDDESDALSLALCHSLHLG